MQGVIENDGGGETGFWVCASGACDYFSDSPDGVPYEDAKRLFEYYDDFHPHMLKGVPPYC